MRNLADPLTIEAIAAITPEAKPIKLFDGGGLFLLINPTGSKLWRFKYRISGKEYSLSFGPYPEVSLESARIMRNDARQLLKMGLDPSYERKIEKDLESAGRPKIVCHTSVRVGIDGFYEIWKDRLALRLSIDEANFVRDQLSKLLI